MKKILFLILAFLTLVCSQGYAANRYGCTALTGGGTGALDALDITASGAPNSDDLADGDSAIVTVISGTTVTVYEYIFDADGTDAESSPDVIRPDDYSSGGVWRLVKFNIGMIPDGTGSGLDADLLDNHNSDYFALASEPIVRIDAVSNLPNARLLTGGNDSTHPGIQIIDNGAGDTVDVIFSPNELNDITWSGGSESSVVWTFDLLLSTDPTINIDSSLFDFSVGVEGQTFIIRDDIPTIEYRDNQLSSPDLVAAKIRANATDPSAGNEDVDISFEVLEDGSNTQKLKIDADGYLEVYSDLNLSSGSVYRINGTQISSSNLSDGSSLLKSSDIGTSVQAWDAYLDDIAAITASQGDILYFNGTDWTNLAPGTSGQFLQTQGAGANPQWATPSGSGDVTGPSSSTDNAIARFDGTGGKTIQNSNVTIDDTGNLSLPSGAVYQINGTQISTQNLSDGSSLMKELADDTTPQLAGNLDSNNFNIYIGDGTYDFDHSPLLGVEGNVEVKGGTLYADSVQTVATTNPGFTGDDSDTTASPDWKIYGDATDPAAGSEDVDVFIQTLVDGSMTTKMQFDADGNVEVSSDLNLASGKVYKIGGTQIAASDLSNGTTGSGNIVLEMSPVIVKPAVTLNRAGTFSSPITTDPYTISATLAKGGILYYGATGTVNLPAGEDGMNLIIYNTGDYTITIDPNGTETIVRDGTQQGAGVSMTLDAGAGHYVCLVYDSGTWITLGYNGTLAEGS